MKIIIFSPTSTKLNCFSDIDEPLGGADATLLKLIRVLGRSNEVVAYIPVSEKVVDDTNENNITYRPFMDAYTTKDNCDLMILYRKIYAMPSNIKYDRIFFYSQDTADTPCFSGLQKEGGLEFMDKFDKIIVLSKFHRDNLISAFNLNPDRMEIIGNAAHGQPLCDKEPYTFVYASTPFRGLDALARIWKRKIIKTYPQAKLHVFSSMAIYKGAAQEHMFTHLYDILRNMKGVEYHGSQNHEVVQDCMAKSKMLLYPNLYPETYCNVIMESRSNHTPFITSSLGALPETGGAAGVYIAGNARSEDYQQRFFEAFEQIMENKDFYDILQKNCYPIRHWSDYANDIEKVIK